MEIPALRLRVPWLDHAARGHTSHAWDLCPHTRTSGAAFSSSICSSVWNGCGRTNVRERALAFLGLQSQDVSDASMAEVPPRYFFCSRQARTVPLLKLNNSTTTGSAAVFLSPCAGGIAEWDFSAPPPAVFAQIWETRAPAAGDAWCNLLIMC